MGNYQIVVYDPVTAGKIGNELKSNPGQEGVNYVFYNLKGTDMGGVKDILHREARSLRVERVEGGSKERVWPQEGKSIDNFLSDLT